MLIALIPARMGSQRLKQKNLRELAGVPLITRAIRKCKEAGVFDEIWVNSEHPAFGDIAAAEGVSFHRRPEELANDSATSEQFVREFLDRHACEYVVQVHSIAPLLSVADIREFVKHVRAGTHDCLFSTESIQIECMYKNRPVNFSLDRKTNSQDLTPVERVSWSITAWRRSTFLEAVAQERCGTYAGSVCAVSIGRFAAHVVKTEEDLEIAAALLPLVPGA